MMKMFPPIIAICLISSFAVPSTLTFSAQAKQSNQELKGYCLEHMRDYPGLNLGECMSIALSSDEGFKTKLCDYALENDLLEEWGFKSFSDCVRNIVPEDF